MRLEPNHSRTTAVDVKSFPAPVVNNIFIIITLFSSLLLQPRSALEAGQTEAHANSFDLTSTSRLHPKDYTSSIFCLSKRIMGNVLCKLERHPFSRPVDSVGGLLHDP